MAVASSWWHMSGRTHARLAFTANPAGTHCSEAMVA